MSSEPNQPKGRRRNVPWPERLKVWVRSGGCCAICGTYLLEGDITHEEFSLGELAHIVGQQTTQRSPRGQSQLSQKDRDKADNLMLVCANEHNEIDRAGALDVITVEKLKKIKQEHEDWIRHITGLDKNRRSVVLRVFGRIRGNEVELTPQTASGAILRSDNRYPDFPLSYSRQGLEIDLRHVLGEIDAGPNYWEACKNIIDEVVDNRLNEGVQKDQVNHLSVFAFARLPVLVYLGSKLDDTYAVEIYQRHRSTESWDWTTEAPNTSFRTDLPSEVNGHEALLILNVSGSIQPNEYPVEVRELPIFLLYPNDAIPTPDIMATRDSLRSFCEVVRLLLSTIEANYTGVRRLHVLGALPISAAVALGRVHDPVVHPKLVIYDRANSAYLPALEI